MVTSTHKHTLHNKQLNAWYHAPTLASAALFDLPSYFPLFRTQPSSSPPSPKHSFEMKKSIYDRLPLHPVLPAELFPVIVGFLPLFSVPSTILSLALASHRFCQIVLPLLFERLVLKTEDDAILVFLQILEDPKRGKTVKELYLSSTLSLSARNGEKAFDAITGLQRIVEKRLLPRLSALGIYLTRLWHYDEEFLPVKSYGHLPNSFWKALHHQCPHLRTIILRNFGDSQHDPWLSKTIVEDIGMFKVSSSSVIPIASI